MTRAERNEKLHQEAIARQREAEGLKLPRLSESSTEECALLIEAAHVWAAHHGIILQE